MRLWVTTLLTGSVTMSAIGLLFMAIKPLLKKRYTEKGLYYAWLIIVLGLIIPFRPHFANPTVSVDWPSVAHAPVIPVVYPVTVIIPDEATTLPAAVPFVSLWQVAAVLWLIGALSVMAHLGIKHYRFLKMTARWREPVTDKPICDLLHSLKTEMGISKPIGLFWCSGIGGPVLTGFIKPRILLPPMVFASDELRLILKHELVHYKRGDLGCKCAVILATAIHWFNPMIYLMAKAINTACEAYVKHRLKKVNVKHYRTWTWTGKREWDKIRQKKAPDEKQSRGR